MALFYVDTSAILKPFLKESNNEDIGDLIADETNTLLSSTLILTETKRAIRRRYANAASDVELANQMNTLMNAVDRALSSFILIELTRARLETAASIADPFLRSLDAIHLATALELKDELSGFITYDTRLSEVATRYGFQTP